MDDLLIYLTDPVYQEEVENLSLAEDYHISYSSDLEEIIRDARLNLVDLIIVWPATLESSTALLSALKEMRLEYIPVVALYRDEEIREKLVKMSFTDCWQIPMPRERFWILIKQLLKDCSIQTTTVEGANWQGSLEEYNLVDLIQMIEARGWDAELTLMIHNHTGVVYFNEGKVIDARFLSLNGLPALLKMAFWSQGRFFTRMSILGEAQKRITISNQEILFAIIEKLHQLEKMATHLPEFNEELLRNPLLDVGDVSPLQKKILDLCERPTRIKDILFSIDEDNEFILQEIIMLLEKSMLGSRTSIEKMLQDSETKPGLGKILTSISSLFKKKEVIKVELSSEDYQAPQQEDGEEAQLQIPQLSLTGEEYHQIQYFLEKHLV